MRDLGFEAQGGAEDDRDLLDKGEEGSEAVPLRSGEEACYHSGK